MHSFQAARIVVCTIVVGIIIAATSHSAYSQNNPVPVGSQAKTTGGGLGKDTAPGGGTSGGKDGKPNEELAQSRAIIPRGDDDLASIRSHAQALLEASGACNNAKCPVLDCAAANTLLQGLLTAEGLLDALYGNLIEAGATIAAAYANVAAQSGITSTQLAQAQDALAWLDYFERLGVALFDLASVSDDVIKMLDGDLSDKSVLEKLDSLYESLKDVEGLANDMAEAGSNAADWSTGSDTSPTTASPLSDATGKALGKSKDEMGRINDLKSNASDAAGTIDSVRKAMKEGKDWKQALKGESGNIRQALEKIAFRELKNQADKKKKELEDQIEELGKDLAAESKTLAALFKERQRIIDRRNAAEDALAAVRRARQSFAACVSRACGASTLSRPQPPVSKHWGEGIRAINSQLPAAAATLAGRIEVKDYCPVPGATSTPGPTDGPTGGGTSPRHLVENNCPACKSIADTLGRILDEIDFVNAEITRIERNGEQVKLLKEKLAIKERQIRDISKSIADLSAAIQQSKVFGTSVAPKVEFTLREYEASRQLMVIEASRLKRQIERMEAEKGQLQKLRDRLWDVNYDRHNLRGDLNYCQRDKCRTRTGTGGGVTEGAATCPQCRGIASQLATAERLLAESRTRFDELTTRIRSYTDAAMKSQLSSSDMNELKRLSEKAKEAEQNISRNEEEVQRLRRALEKCVEACQEAGEFVERVIPREGNDPFDPQNPLGPTTPRTPSGCAGSAPWGSKMLACPAGYSGYKEETTPYSCINGNWVAGKPVIADNCTPVSGCTGPAPVSESQTQQCPTGQTGTIIQNRSYSCVNGAWIPGAWTTTSNTCTTPQPAGCTGTAPISESQTQACPSGQVGIISQTRSYSCVNGAWTPGAWQTISNSCTCNPATQPQPDGQNLSCPAGQTGSITQQRAYVCASGSWVPGTNWVTVANTCTAVPAGCATNYSGGNYVCGGTCGLSSTSLSVTSGSNTMTATFGSNTNIPVNCSGATGNPQSTNLIILGLPGHTCTFAGASLTSFGISCRNNSGGTCNSSCSR